jgi:Ribbon-helix-helix protein, copG family
MGREEVNQTETLEAREPDLVEGEAHLPGEGTKSERSQRRKTDRTQLTVNLPCEVVDALRSLAQERGVTMTEVLRQAVTTEKFLADAQRQGDTILLRNERTKRTRELLLR